MSSIRISYLPGGEKDRDPRGVDVTWEQLCEALGSKGVKPSPCDSSTCGQGEHALLNDRGKVVGCRHKYGGAWSPAVYPPGATRSKKNVGVVSLFVLDLDHLTDEEVLPIAERLAPYRYVCHSSHSDRRVVVRGHLESGEPIEVEERALRVVVALSEPVLGADWPRFWQTAVELLSGSKADLTVCDSSRLYFLPTRRSDCEFTYTTNEGRALDVRAVLAMAPPPEKLPELAGSDGEFPPASPALIERARDRLKKIGPAVEGEGGDARAYSACCALLHDFALSDAEAWPLLVEWNLTCRPPWDHGDLRVKMENGRTYADGPRGAGRLEFEGAEAIRDMFGTVDDVLPSERPADPEPVELEVPAEGDVLAILGHISAKNPASSEPRGEPGTWSYELALARRDVARALAAGLGDQADEGELQLFQAATQLLSGDPKPVSWLVRGLLTEGGVSGIIGEPKTTKSWLAIEAALCVASGRPFLGKFAVPEPRHAAYFFAEDHHEGVASRLRAFAAGAGMTPEALAKNLHVQPRGKYLDLSKDEDVARVVASARMIEGRLGLLVLDPLRDVHSGKENESDDMAGVFKRIRLISVLLDCAVLVVHHSKKPGKDGASNGSEIRGSSVINGALDARIIIKNMESAVDDAKKETVFSSGIEVVVKRGRSAGNFQAQLLVVDDEGDSAILARWSHITHGQVALAKETKKDGNVQEQAFRVVEYLFACEMRREPLKTHDQIRAALKIGKTTVNAAIEFALAKMWLEVSPSGVKKQLTDVGRAFLREAEAKDSAPRDVVPPQTLDQIVGPE